MSNKRPIMALLIAILALIPSVYGFTLTGSTSGVGFEATYKVGDDDEVSDSTVFTEGGLLRSLDFSGGNLEETHWVANNDGARAEVGVHIVGAKGGCSYDYELYPPEGGGGWPDTFVMAQESLTAEDAEYISAFAVARNPLGGESGTDIEVHQGSLIGYTNWAVADSSGLTFAMQSADSISGKEIKTDTWTSNEDGDYTSVSMKVNEGSVAEYHDDTAYSYDHQKASQGAYTITGKDIESYGLVSDVGGDCVGAGTIVKDGSISEYYSNDARLRYGTPKLLKVYQTTPAIGKEIKSYAWATNTNGDCTSVCTDVKEGHTDSGSQQAYSLTQGNVKAVDAYQHADAIDGEEIESYAWATKTNGDCTSVSTDIKEGHIDNGVQRASVIPINAQVVEAYQRTDDASGEKIELKAVAFNAEDYVEEVCTVTSPYRSYLNLGRVEEGDLLAIQVLSEYFGGAPGTWP